VVGPAARTPAHQGAALLDAVLRRAPARKRGAFAQLQAACFGRARDAGLLPVPPVVTVDATGLERHHVSAHFVDRRGPLLGRRRRHWPKLTAVADTATHLIAGAVVTRGPSQDSPQFPAAVRQAARLLAPHTLLGDAGYDAEHNHGLCRALGIAASVIALNRRNMGRRWPLTPERRALRRQFPRALYRQRWHAESVFSRHKRRLGSALTARGARAQRREVLLRVLTHNLMVLRPGAQKLSTEQNRLLARLWPFTRRSRLPR